MGTQDSESVLFYATAGLYNLSNDASFEDGRAQTGVVSQAALTQRERKPGHCQVCLRYDRQLAQAPLGAVAAPVTCASVFESAEQCLLGSEHRRGKRVLPNEARAFLRLV